MQRRRWRWPHARSCPHTCTAVVSQPATRRRYTKGVHAAARRSSARVHLRLRGACCCRRPAAVDKAHCIVNEAGSAGKLRDAWGRILTLEPLALTPTQVREFAFRGRHPLASDPPRRLQRRRQAQRRRARRQPRHPRPYRSRDWCYASWRKPGVCPTQPTVSCFLMLIKYHSRVFCSHSWFAVVGFGCFVSVCLFCCLYL